MLASSALTCSPVNSPASIRFNSAILTSKLSATSPAASARFSSSCFARRRHHASPLAILPLPLSRHAAVCIAHPDHDLDPDPDLDHDHDLHLDHHPHHNH